MTQRNKLIDPPETEIVTRKQLQDDLGELLHLFKLQNQQNPSNESTQSYTPRPKTKRR